MTWKVSVAVPAPPALVAVTVYVAEEETTEGVPLISPVEVEKTRPVGSVGVIDHDVMVPPLAVGVTVVMATSLVSVKELGL